MSRSEREQASTHGAGEELASPSRTLEKGLQVLSLFDVLRPEWTFKEIRETAGLPKATGFRLVKTLERLKYLAYDPATSTYRLGSAMMRAAFVTQTHSALVQTAKPFVQSLADVTTETVDLSVPTDQGAMLLHTVYTARPFRPYSPPGLMMTGLTNIHTKLFTALGPESRWPAVVAQSVPRTPLSLVGANRLMEELAAVRRDRLALGIEEYTLGMCAVGAPVFDSTGDVRAAIAVVTPVERFGEEERRSHSAAVAETAKALSKELGYRDDGAR